MKFHGISLHGSNGYAMADNIIAMTCWRQYPPATRVEQYFKFRAGIAGFKGADGTDAG
jgi:hypothetical protein